MNGNALKPRMPSIDEMKRILQIVADAIGVELVDGPTMLFLGRKTAKGEFYAISQVYQLIYSTRTGFSNLVDKHQRLLAECMSREKFADGTMNPFNGCKSLEEVKIRADLIRGYGNGHRRD